MRNVNAQPARLKSESVVDTPVDTITSMISKPQSYRWLRTSTGQIKKSNPTCSLPNSGQQNNPVTVKNKSESQDDIQLIRGVGNSNLAKKWTAE